MNQNAYFIRLNFKNPSVWNRQGIACSINMHEIAHHPKPKKPHLPLMQSIPASSSRSVHPLTKAGTGTFLTLIFSMLALNSMAAVLHLLPGQFLYAVLQPAGLDGVRANPEKKNVQREKVFQ
ncbi:hypothetical protein AVEN_120635-1 [Araneus ventricosus]|uniref:Uncharacterized protein n=1 Tax=Araneus ventricosus TaxID=182803 RepID=A0A4Y2PST5_ARAVE|nr:hypothetical protein AVEN_120635-1 [Araneus ventricosus]